jgi:hypothetical protein
LVWLRANYDAMKTQLTDLSPMRNGVPFALAFSEVWHAVFGYATRELAEDGFYANPRSAAASYPGYMPLVWQNDVMQGP